MATAWQKKSSPHPAQSRHGEGEPMSTPLLLSLTPAEPSPTWEAGRSLVLSQPHDSGEVRKWGEGTERGVAFVQEGEGRDFHMVYRLKKVPKGSHDAVQSTWGEQLCHCTPSGSASNGE